MRLVEAEATYKTHHGGWGGLECYILVVNHEQGAGRQVLVTGARSWL